VESSPAQWRHRLGVSMFVLWLVPSSIDAIELARPVLPVVVFSAAYAFSYLAAWWFVRRWTPRRRVAWVVLVYLFGIGYVVAVGSEGALAELGYAIAVTILLLPLGLSRLVGISTIVVGVAAYWVLEHQIAWSDALIMSLVISTLLGVNRMTRTVHKLQSARAEIRALAVANERARLARDLHDVLGHSLTTITVKTGLARRLLESGADIERVRDELRDTEQLSRRALADIRATVSDQRRMSLAAELVVARSALRAAGIEADLPYAVDDVEARLEEPLAYVLREGVTNVVRHSGAGRCAVRLGARWLEVTDNGAGPSGPAGNGLTGLGERLADVHGTIEAGPLPGGGFRLRAQVPSEAPA
jgi:two-component system, NarL family, sensor histidine kinase DesK